MLDRSMNPLVAFAVYATVTMKNNLCINIPYDIVNVDTHTGWNKTTNNYAVPISGVYVLSMAVTSLRNPIDQGHFIVNKTFFATSYFCGLSVGGEDSFGGTVIVNVQQNDRIGGHLCIGNSSNPPQRYEMSMFGFLLSPKDIQPVTFSAFRTTPASGFLDPIDYDDVNINIGNGWNAETKKFITPYDGVYYVYMSFLTEPNQPIRIEILLNGVPVTSFISYNSASMLKRDQRMYDFILRLVKNDELRFRQPTGFAFYANANRHMYVSIFRVHT